MLQIIISFILASFLAVLYIRIVKEDNISGKIRNAFILRGLAAVVIAILLLAAQTSAENIFPLLNPALPAIFFKHYLRHAAISFFVSFSLWEGGTWPAGDAKLFILSALALPVLITKPSYFPNLLFFAMLLNIFLPAAIAFILRAAIDALKSFVKNTASDTAAVFKLSSGALIQVVNKIYTSGRLSEVLIVTIFFGAARFIRDFYPQRFHFNDFQLFAGMMLVWPIISKPIKMFKLYVFYIIAAGAIICLFYPQGKTFLIFSLYGLSKSIPFILFYESISALMDSDTLIMISPQQIQPGVILAGNYLKKLKAAAPDFFSECFQGRYRDGLTQEEADKLLEFINKPDTSTELKNISARSARPFAAWIALGTFITLGLNGDTIINLCRYLWHILSV